MLMSGMGICCCLTDDDDDDDHVRLASYWHYYCANVSSTSITTESAIICTSA